MIVFQFRWFSGYLSSFPRKQESKPPSPFGLATCSEPCQRNSTIAKYTCPLMFTHPELVEGCLLKSPMVRQGHHKEAGKGFAIDLTSGHLPLARTHATVYNLLIHLFYFLLPSRTKSPPEMSLSSNHESSASACRSSQRDEMGLNRTENEFFFPFPSKRPGAALRRPGLNVKMGLNWEKWEEMGLLWETSFPLSRLMAQ